ncbi:hypothetical protein LX83_003458 [Goodfellowiella coeruleoviolacea]|uniref:Uncharacterized protein n=1 Tax=Goodfellowiella coeruleoviolacea TaxID=334858 RepID=A0AAE3GFV4_9PSEU|nr:hypothetical protein [Goodfellowiella coeruleoviolacea]
MLSCGFIGEGVRKVPVRQSRPDANDLDPPCGPPSPARCEPARPAPPDHHRSDWPAAPTAGHGHADSDCPRTPRR